MPLGNVPASMEMKRPPLCTNCAGVIFMPDALTSWALRMGERRSRQDGDAAEAESYLERQTLMAAKGCMEEERGRVLIRIEPLLDLDPFIRRRILYKGLSLAAGQKKDLGQVHVRMLEDLLTGGGSASLSLPGGVRARREWNCW